MAKSYKSVTFNWLIVCRVLCVKVVSASWSKGCLVNWKLTGTYSKATERA